MSKVIFTPWKTHSDLLAVRNQFYPPPEYDGPDLRSQACATVSAWKLRGNLPHPVEATALLTDAILHDDASKNSLFAIRATYAAAFCRFVTGLVDSKLGVRRSMFSRALELGLPASFVELRHEATHRELPSLTVLRGATGRSLEWLWGFYWGGLSSGPLSGSGVGVGSAVDGLAREVLEQAGALLGNDNGIGNEGGCGNGGADGPPRKKRRIQRELAGIAARAVGILKEHWVGEAGEQEEATCKPGRILARIMLRDGFLVPSGRRLNETQSLTTSISKWDPFLQIVAEGDSSFPATLTETMADELAFPASNSGPDPKSDPVLEGIYTWLDHVLHSPQWESQRRLISLSYTRAVCESCSSGNYWMAMLKERMTKFEEGKKKGKGKGDADGLPEDARTSHASTAVEESGLLDVNQEDMKTLSRFGWELAEMPGWDSRALRVVG
ncbi:Las1-like-domain-containing protein [Aspergillus navahoensis]